VPEKEISVNIPFGNLRMACVKRGLKARLYVFDGGNTVEVTDAEGKQLCRTTAEHGDPISATLQAAKLLMEQGHLTMFDFEWSA
jgi:hypothetical protein